MSKVSIYYFDQVMKKDLNREIFTVSRFGQDMVDIQSSRRDPEGSCSLALPRTEAAEDGRNDLEQRRSFRASRPRPG